jgi:hypothetical protein
LKGFVNWVQQQRDTLPHIYKHNPQVSIMKTIYHVSKYDLMFGKLGNGITVSNRKVSDPSTKDYKKVAHISTDGKIQWHDKDAQRDSSVRREVEKHAKKMY